MRLLTLFFMAFVSMLVGVTAKAQTRATSSEATGAWMTATPEEVDAAIFHILEKEPGHRLYKDSEARMALAEAVVKVCEEKEVPPLFALSIIFRESSFDEKAVGLLGEFGLMQVAKGNVKRLRCNMDNAEGQIECGTRMLKEAYEVCRSWGGALMRYATTTGSCTHDDPSVNTKIKLRLKDWQRLSKFVQLELYEQGAQE